MKVLALTPSERYEEQERQQAFRLLNDPTVLSGMSDTEIADRIVRKVFKTAAKATYEFGIFIYDATVMAIVASIRVLATVIGSAIPLVGWILSLSGNAVATGIDMTSDYVPDQIKFVLGTITTIALATFPKVVKVAWNNREMIISTARRITAETVSKLADWGVQGVCWILRRFMGPAGEYFATAIETGYAAFKAGASAAVEVASQVVGGAAEVADVSINGVAGVVQGAARVVLPAARNAVQMGREAGAIMRAKPDAAFVVWVADFVLKMKKPLNAGRIPQGAEEIAPVLEGLEEIPGVLNGARAIADAQALEAMEPRGFMGALKLRGEGASVGQVVKYLGDEIAGNIARGLSDGVYKFTLESLESVMKLANMLKTMEFLQGAQKIASVVKGLADVKKAMDLVILSAAQIAKAPGAEQAAAMFMLFREYMADVRGLEYFSEMERAAFASVARYAASIKVPIEVLENGAKINLPALGVEIASEASKEVTTVREAVEMYRAVSSSARDLANVENGVAKFTVGRAATSLVNGTISGAATAANELAEIPALGVFEDGAGTVHEVFGIADEFGEADSLIRDATVSERVIAFLAKNAPKTMGEIARFMEANSAVISTTKTIFKSIGDFLMAVGIVIDAVDVATDALDIKAYKKYIKEHPHDPWSWKMHRRIEFSEGDLGKDIINTGVDSAILAAFLLAGPAGVVAAGGAGVAEIIGNFMFSKKRDEEFMRKWYGAYYNPDVDVYIDRRDAAKKGPKVRDWMNWVDSLDPEGYSVRMESIITQLKQTKDEFLELEDGVRAGLDDNRYERLLQASQQYNSLFLNELATYEEEEGADVDNYDVRDEDTTTEGALMAGWNDDSTLDEAFRYAHVLTRQRLDNIEEGGHTEYEIELLDAYDQQQRAQAYTTHTDREIEGTSMEYIPGAKGEKEEEGAQVGQLVDLELTDARHELANVDDEEVDQIAYAGDGSEAPAQDDSQQQQEVEPERIKRMRPFLEHARDFYEDGGWSYDNKARYNQAGLVYMSYVNANKRQKA